MRTIESELCLPLEVTYEYYAGRPSRDTFCGRNYMLVSAEPEVEPEVEVTEVMLNGKDIRALLTPEQMRHIEDACMKDANEEEEP